ncbi:MAG: hypothetical protein ACOY4R_02065 [Pseudomonadota bacterium]
MQRRRLAGATAWAAALWLLPGAALAQYCDNLEGQDVHVEGVIDKAVEAAGVVFFRDRKTSCQFGIVMSRTDAACKQGAQIEASGKLVKNRFLPDTYDIDRGPRPAPGSLVCK